MPKTKRKDSDTSDSGPDDVSSWGGRVEIRLMQVQFQKNVAPSKKAKKSSTGASATEGKEPEFPLDKNRMVRVRSFKGKAYIDIREYYQKDGEQLPGKKGISLSPEQWRKLLEHVDGINKAVEKI